MTINPYSGLVEFIEPGFQLIDGTLLNEIILRLNALQGNAFELAPDGKILTLEDNGVLFSNEGASALSVFILPNASVGLKYGFVVEDPDGLQVVSRLGDIIYLGDSASSSGGTVSSLLPGAYLQLVAISSTKWVASSFTSAWTST